MKPHNKTKNLILLENLMDRLKFDEQHGQYLLPGIITQSERDSLEEAITALRSEIRETETTVTVGIEEAAQIRAPRVHAQSSAAEVREEAEETGHAVSEVVSDTISSEGIEKLLNVSVLSKRDFLDDIRIGIDFGTAYSKACMIATVDAEETIHDLPLGIFAGEDSLEMPVHSSLFIGTDARLYFGPIAVEKSEEMRGQGLARIDSIKAFLIDEERVTIDDSPLQKVYNPTDIEVPKTALIVFYLGYLIFLIRESAKDRHDIDIGLVRRRVSLPCYGSAHRDKVIGELYKLFAAGEVLGASFDNEWEAGFRLQDVLYFYNWMRANVSSDSPYIERFLEEPLAVASSRLSASGSSSGQVCMVMDIGAGTTDFTMFEIFANAASGYSDVREITGSSYGVPVAGDTLDTILLAYILRESGISRTAENYREVVTSLRLDIRDYKERLMKESELTYSMPGGATGRIVLSEFLQHPSVRNFTADLRKAMVHVLEAIHPSWMRSKIARRNLQPTLPVIVTGGGANLPMIKSLIKGSVSANGGTVDLFLSPRVPAWLENEYEGEIISLYPQMAVAIGGSKKFVIDKAVAEEDFAL